ncbi:MAG: CvpA family protein [Clostridia bacterium]|nr:CvpA family protein [Clostridia bacterium]
MSWILDVIFFIILLFGIFLGARAGFIKSVCKIAGVVFAGIVAFTFANALSAKFEEWFGFTSLMASGALSMKVAGWISYVICFILLAVLTKLAAWLLGKVGTALAESIKPFEVINRFAGGLFGLIEAFFVIILIMSICYWIGNGLNVTALNDFISSSGVVGAIYKSDFFLYIAEFQFMNDIS